MPDLSFQVASVAPVQYAAAPLLNFTLQVNNAVPDEPIHSVSLACQLRIEPTQRRYEQSDHARLRDLFGEPQQWSRTVRSMLWTHTSVIIPPFSGGTLIDLPVPCTYDFNVASTKYFGALEDGEIPLALLFSGSIFYAGADGHLQVTQISWNSETTFRLPVQVWREMMELYYPNSTWINLQRDVFERLNSYKIRHGRPTWEQALEDLLARAEADETQKVSP